MTEYPIFLYKSSDPEIYLDDEDTLIWSGTGGAVTLSVKDIRKWIKRIDKLTKEQKNDNKRNTK